VKWHQYVSATAAVLLALTGSAARAADIALEMVTVGNPGNANDTTGYGGVDYAYSIGKYEVTAGQYTEFLNAVAKTDTYGLYNIEMLMSEYGCQIEQSGTVGGYTYGVPADRANRPVNYVSFWDAARFMNWLHNGQGSGDTESGAYANVGNPSTFTRNADAKFWIPTENEWYKAAYHKSGSVTGDYWDYPTSSDTINTSMANYGNSLDHTTVVGAYPYASPYGTFDQGGNVWELNESAISSSPGLWGGSWVDDSDRLLSSYRYSLFFPTDEYFLIGFRVASVPEPSSLTLMLCGSLAGLYWWKRRK
jgi:formylglycine-generating enzyme required for sulfatase activity